VLALYCPVLYLRVLNQRFCVWLWRMEHALLSAYFPYSRYIVYPGVIFVFSLRRIILGVFLLSFFYCSTAQVGLGLLCEVPRLHYFSHTTFGRTPLDKWSVRRRDLYLTTRNTHNRQTSMSLEGFEPTIPASERRQTHALERTATGIDHLGICKLSFPHRTVFGTFLT
jgi:hypothetical protein